MICGRCMRPSAPIGVTRVHIDRLGNTADHVALYPSDRSLS